MELYVRPLFNTVMTLICQSFRLSLSPNKTTTQPKSTTTTPTKTTSDNALKTTMITTSSTVTAMEMKDDKEETIYWIPDFVESIRKHSRSVRRDRNCLRDRHKPRASEPAVKRITNPVLLYSFSTPSLLSYQKL